MLVKEIFFRLFCCLLYSIFYFLIALQSDNNSNTILFMFLDINIFWAHLRACFNPDLTARAKMSLTQVQNIFMPPNKFHVSSLLKAVKDTYKVK